VFFSMPPQVDSVLPADGRRPGTPTISISSNGQGSTKWPQTMQARIVPVANGAAMGAARPGDALPFIT
jgi:hypothetical protein